MSEMEIQGLDELEIENSSIDEIDNESVNLIFVATDESGSMSSYVSTMKASLTDFKTALMDSKEIDEIRVSRANFYNGQVDIVGYKPIVDFSIDYTTYGGTPLYDAICEGAEKLINYMNLLKQNGMRVKAVFSVFSDGGDTSSIHKMAAARKAIDDLNNLEITTAFIGFGQEALQTATDLNFKNILSAGDSASELRKAFNVLSKSVIESSKSVVPDAGNFFVV